MSRKLFIVGLIVVTLIGLVPTTSFARETQTIRYFNFSSDPDHVEDLATIVAAFEAEHPDIKVEVSSAPFADYFTLLQADFAGGKPADVIELNYENFVSYAANGVLADVSSYLSADAPYYPRALEAFQYNGQQLALPETFSTVLLFYNKDLFDQAGIAYPTPEWTWDDAMTAAKAIRALGDDIWGIYSPIQFWEFYKKAAQNDCAFFNADQTESTINSEACVGALDTMLSFVNEDVMPDTAELAGVANEDLFSQGKLGMDVIGIWMFAAFKDAPFAWDVQLEPAMLHQGHHFFSNGVAVTADSKYPEAAAAWAQYLTASETAAKLRVEKGWELPALDKPEYFQAYLEQTPPANRAAVFQALESPVVPPVIVRQAEMQDAVNAVLDAAANGQIDAQAALDSAKEQIDALLK